MGFEYTPKCETCGGDCGQCGVSHVPFHRECGHRHAESSPCPSPASYMVIVPNSLSDAIYANIDEALKKLSIYDCPASDRENMYKQLLSYFNEHGQLPDFSIVKKPDGRAVQQ